MDIIQDCLRLVPVPYLDLAFRIFANIWTSIEQIQNCKSQLIVLSKCIASLLRSLHTQYTSQRLVPEATATPLLELRLLLEEISHFVKEQSDSNFVKMFVNQTQSLPTIENYHRRVAAAVSAFQISALVDISEWQRLEAEAREADRRALHERLNDISIDITKLKETLQVELGNVRTVMTALAQAQRQYSPSDPESGFITISLERLNKWSNFQVEIEKWTITPFEVKFGQMIGSGGFGKIHKGTWHGVEVALKVFNAGGPVVPNEKAIIREIKAWSDLRHPHIIQFFGANVLDDNPFLVMPYYKNGNARDYVLDNLQCNRLKIVYQASQGLAYLHSRNIIHADIKAANILISDAETAILCDFGLARVKAEMSTRSTTLQAQSILGSRNWMAPERLQGGLPRFPGDIYALGMTIYEIYTGQTPLGDADPSEFRELVVDKNVRPEKPEADEAAQLTDDVWQLAESCWAKDTKQRPVAGVLCSTLGQLLEMSQDSPLQPRTAVDRSDSGGSPPPPFSTNDFPPPFPSSLPPSPRRSPSPCPTPIVVAPTPSPPFLVDPELHTLHNIRPQDMRGRSSPIRQPVILLNQLPRRERSRSPAGNLPNLDIRPPDVRVARPDHKSPVAPPRLPPRRSDSEPPEAFEESIEIIREMGFDRETIVAALKRNDYDMSEAIEELTSPL